MQPVFVKPAKGARVRQPERGSAVMTEAGGWVPRNVHYEQLIQTGDVIVVDPQPAVPTPSAAPAASAEPAADLGKSVSAGAEVKPQTRTK